MQISEAELVVMEALWARQPRTAAEICEAVAEPHGWQASTVKTLLNRLLNKGAVTAEKVGRHFSYAPVIARETWLKEQSVGLLERLFGGRVAPLVAHFSAQRRLDPSDVAELRSLLDSIDDGRR